ncbi:WXG100 family type VII secretion target [Streptomyces sp. NPDC051684]|uniref:WXG100 family type VII secretion target n=1 Tax=Streptomyces sp. NPDC051684 TaxID=3365670 RepID=UPI00379DDECA
MSGDSNGYQAPTQCYVGDNTTNFKNHDMDTMKSMVQNADPGAVHEAAQGWKGVHDQLAEIKSVYEAAVAEVLQDWEGTSADQFQARSKVVSKKIHDTSTYASYVSTAMTSAGNVLGDIKPEVMAMEKPSGGSSAWDKVTDGGRDEDGLNRDIANKNVSAQQIVDGREGDMSEGREAQMKMAVKMEQLGAGYSAQTKAMGTWRGPGKKVEDGDAYPGEPSGAAPVPIVAGSVASPSASTGSGALSRAGGSGSSAKGVKSPTANGISGGIGSQKPTAGSQIGAGNLSFGGGSGAGTAGIGASSGAGAGGVGGGMSGSGAGASGTGGAGIGGGIGAGAGLGAGAAGRGGAGAMGRGGLGGGAGAGAAGKDAAKGLKGNSLARTKGGEIGKSVVKPGSGQQGGSALRQKPKTATGGTGKNAGRNGLAGHGAQTGGKDKKRRENSRPDYLVEDEQTWANGRTVNPKVVE